MPSWHVRIKERSLNQLTPEKKVVTSRLLEVPLPKSVRNQPAEGDGYQEVVSCAYRDKERRRYGAEAPIRVPI